MRAWTPVAEPLFASTRPGNVGHLPAEACGEAIRVHPVSEADAVILPSIDARVLEVFDRAHDPENPIELRNLWVGRVESELGPCSIRPELARVWRASRTRRRTTPDEVLSSRATVRFVKELFNFYFRDDLYGALRSDDHRVLSSGSVDEEAWGLPETLKDCIRYALDRDWYGYSDSCGRIPVREAVAAYENGRLTDDAYGPENVALTMGGTTAISSVSDFLLSGADRSSSPVLCAIPNYPPIVESIARRSGIRLVPLAACRGRMAIDPLIEALTPSTPLVMLQTAANPTGASVSETELGRLITAASPSTTILLDECHEWLGPMPSALFSARAAANVVRICSLSKAWSTPGMKIGWILADQGFISEYYEYASTTFGGPPSLFYTTVEVLARMERWIAAGLETIGISEVGEFERSYGLNPTRLQRAYDRYRAERAVRARDLKTLREATVRGLSDAKATVWHPRYSINVAMRLDLWDDSYRCFRDLLREQQVAVYPGILNFCFSGGIARITTACQWHHMSAGLAGIRAAVAERQLIAPDLPPLTWKTTR